MATVDETKHDLQLHVLVLGGASERFVEALSLESGGVLNLPDLQGWHPHITFRQFPLDPWAGDGAQGKELEEFIPYVDGLVLTDAYEEGTHYSSTAVERLSRTFPPNKRGLPAAVFGGPALAQEWSSLSGKELVITVDPRPENAQAVLKPLVKALLKSRIRSMPPPPESRG